LKLGLFDKSAFFSPEEGLSYKSTKKYNYLIKNGDNSMDIGWLGLHSSQVMLKEQLNIPF
jgi:hypothetical protein